MKLTFCISVPAFWADTLIVSDVVALVAIMTIHVSELSRKRLVLVQFNSLVINATAITFTPDIADLAKQYNEAILDRPHLHHPVCLSHYKMLLQRVQRWVMRPVWVHVVHHHFVLSFSSCWFLFLILVNILSLHFKFEMHLKVKVTLVFSNWQAWVHLTNVKFPGLGYPKPNSQLGWFRIFFHEMIGCNSMFKACPCRLNV